MNQSTASRTAVLQQGGIMAGAAKNNPIKGLGISTSVSFGKEQKGTSELPIDPLPLQLPAPAAKAEACR